MINNKKYKFGKLRWSNLFLILISISSIYFVHNLITWLILRFASSSTMKSAFGRNTTYIINQQQVIYYLKNNKFTNNFDDLNLNKIKTNSQLADIKGNVWFAGLKGDLPGERSGWFYTYKITHYDLKKIAKIKAIPKSNFSSPIHYRAVIRVYDRDKNSQVFRHISCDLNKADEEEAIDNLINFIEQYNWEQFYLKLNNISRCSYLFNK